MSKNIDTVMGIYAAFGTGDVGHIIAQLADDVSWDEGIRHTGLPYLVPGRGKDHAASFFGALAANVEFTTFEPAAPCESDDVVMVAIREAGRNLTTGMPIAEDISVHIWTFDEDGQVAKFRHVGDFANHEHAARAVATAS